MKKEETIGHSLARTNNLIGQYISCITKDETQLLSPIQLRIIEYLYLHKEDNVHQREIENLFSIRRSTVTGILNNMEKNGIIYRIVSKSDSRCKIIHLTDQYIKKGKEIANDAKRIDNIIEKGFSDRQKQTLLSLLQKIRNNIIEERNNDVKNI